jgi:hypothetical protein
MAVRARYNISYAASSTSAEEKDLANVRYEVVTDGSNEGGIRKNVVPGGAVDIPLDMASVADAKFLLIRTSSKDPTMTPVEIRIRFNTVVGEQLRIIPLSGTKEGHLLISTTGLTALYASNMGSVDMDVIVGLVGD